MKEERRRCRYVISTKGYKILVKGSEWDTRSWVIDFEGQHKERGNFVTKGFSCSRTFSVQRESESETVVYRVMVSQAWFAWPGDRPNHHCHGYRLRRI